MKERCDRKWPQRSFWSSLGEIWGWDHKPKQLNNQQRGQHRRLGNAPWAALAGCIMPPNLFGHTMSGHSWGSHEVAYFVGKGETNGAIELSRLRGSERYAACFDEVVARAVRVPQPAVLSALLIIQLFGIVIPPPYFS